MEAAPEMPAAEQFSRACTEALARVLPGMLEKIAAHIDRAATSALRLVFLCSLAAGGVAGAAPYVFVTALGSALGNFALHFAAVAGSEFDLKLYDRATLQPLGALGG